MKTAHKILLTVLSIAVFVLFFIVTFGNRGLVDVYYLKKDMKSLTERNLQLEKDNAELRRTIYRLIEDPEYVESVAREELGMVGKNEIIYHFKSEDKPKNDP